MSKLARGFLAVVLSICLSAEPVFAERTSPDAVILFATGNDRIPPSNEPTLRQLAEDAKADPANWIRLEGFAEHQGSRELNLAMAQRRIQEVSNSLTTLGIPSHRIIGTNYGEDTIEPSDLPMQRVEIRIEKMGRN